MIDSTLCSYRKAVSIVLSVACNLLWSSVATQAGVGKPQVEHVIHISVDGLRGSAIEQLGPSMLPNLYRIRAEGAYTDNARTLLENTVTMPNHMSMITGRPRDGAGGHHVTRNSDPAGGGPIGPGSVSITNIPQDVIRGTGALRIDDGLGPNYVRVNESILAGTPGSITSTVMGWYKFDDLNSDGADTRNMIWETGPTDFTSSLGIRTDASDGQKHTQWFTRNPSTGGTTADLPTIHQGDWHHAAVVIDEANDNLKFYHDGALVDDVNINGLLFPRGSGSSQFFIGNHRAGDGSRNWDGFIDDLAVVNGLVSNSEIQGIFAGTKTVADVGE